MEVYWFHLGFLSVCLSVKKKWFRFLYNIFRNSSSNWHTMMILHIYVDLDMRRTSIDFGSKGQIWTLNFFAISAPQLYFLLSYNNDTSHMYWPWPEKDLYHFASHLVKGQCKIRNLNFLQFLPFPHGTAIPFWRTMMIPWYYDYIMGSRIKGKGYISCVNYWLSPHCISNTFWHTIMILQTCVSYEPRRTSINFGVKRSRLNLESLNLLPREGEVPLKTG